VKGDESDVNPRSFGVSVEIKSYGIELDQKTKYVFPSFANSNYTPPTHTVTVSNTGTQPTGALTAALSGANATDFVLTGASIASINKGGTATFTVAPKASLPVGDYVATVTVSGGEKITAQSFDVQFVISATLLRIKTMPDKLNYGIQEPLDIKGLEVEIQHGDGAPWDPCPVTLANCTHDFSAAGEEIEVTITVEPAAPIFFKVKVLTLAQRVAAALGKTETIVLYADETYSGASIPVNVAESDITITTPAGSTTTRVFKRVENRGILFTVGNTGTTDATMVKAKLTVSGYVTLQGLATSEYGGTDVINNNNSLLFVCNGGTLELKGHAKVTGNANVVDEAVWAGGIKVRGNSAADYVHRAFLIMDENAEVSGNSSVSTGAATAAYGGGVEVTESAVAYLRGNAKISNNLARATGTGNATGGGIHFHMYSMFYMEGGEISGNTVQSNAQASGGGVSQWNNSGYAYILGGVIKDNVLKYGTSARGGAIRIAINNRVFISTAASIIPKAGGTLDVVAKTENRNAISVRNRNPDAGRINIFEDLTSSFVPVLVDVETTWTEADALIYKCSTLGSFEALPIAQPTFAAYTDDAPVSKFILGHSVNITDGTITSLETKEIKPNGRIGDK
jgi:hypothetical protein